MDTRFYKIFLVLLGVSVMAACGRQGANNGSAVAGETAAAASKSAQVLLLDDSAGPSTSDTIDMGKMRSGEIVSKPLFIKNAGREPVVIIDVDKTCGCVDLNYSRQPLKPGDEAPLEIEFDSRGIRGWVYKTAILKTSSPQGEHLIVVTADVE